VAAKKATATAEAETAEVTEASSEQIQQDEAPEAAADTPKEDTTSDKENKAE
jgi:hypothetical protein